MSEEDVRGGLRDAVADEPPLDFDPDTLVATARQESRRRRALMAAGAATAVVAVAAVALPGMLGRGQTQVGDRPAATTSSTAPSASSQSSPIPAQPVRYTAEELRRRSHQFEVHLRGAVPLALPTASAFEYGEFGGEAAGDFHDGQTYVNAPVSFTMDGERYSIFVTVWVPGAEGTSPEQLCGGLCQQLGERDGGPIMTRTEELGEATIVTVYHFRKDGGVVSVNAYNYDGTGDVVGYLPSVPVTLEQLTRLATDPELGL